MRPRGLVSMLRYLVECLLVTSKQVPDSTEPGSLNGQLSEAFCINIFPESDVATTVLSLFGYLLIDCTWTSIYLMTSELFPTVLR